MSIDTSFSFLKKINDFLFDGNNKKSIEKSKVISTMGLLTFLIFTSMSCSQKTQQSITIPTAIKVATFNVSMDATNYLNRGEVGKGNELINSLKTNHQQIKNIAEVIQHVRPDILLLNEFDYIKAPSQGIEKFINDYLNESQQGALPIDYPYYYYAPVNTGVSTPFDLDNNGKKSGNMADAFGFGHFPGHFGMVLLSRYPIDTNNIRTFQNFLWHKMPNALQPKDPTTNENWYSDEEWHALRLSSKSHWDIPVTINNKTLHVLASHPTPPVFDGPEDRNGARNHDEIRFWNDYITPQKSDYIIDDQGLKGGIDTNSRFVILGDQNASPDEGAALTQGISALLTNPLTNNEVRPSSTGGKENSDSEYASSHTASWKMRADYVIPSKLGLTVNGSGIFWPTKSEPLFRLINTRLSSSDHRLVWLDLTVK